MSAEALLRALAEVSIASSAAIVTVGVLRKPIRRMAGARVAYWSWIAVPASLLALWLPLPSPATGAMTHSFAISVIRAGQPASVTASAGLSSGAYPATVLALWVCGVLLMTLWLMHRQHAFMRSLGPLTRAADGPLRSDRIAAPMLIGVWRPRIVLPADFEARYPEEDRGLMLAHERAHLQRCDILVNSVTAASSCLLWFNPLIYWAASRVRFDQELACDAVVLARSEASRKRYADALLKAQLVSDSTRWVPVGCHWRSGHPLKERITMLRLASPGFSRRLCGVAFNAVLIASSMSAVSLSLAHVPPPPASHASRPAHCAASAEKKFTLDARNTDTRTVLAMIARKGDHNILVSDRVHGKVSVHLTRL
jgi:bla regulator protein BlaR1